MARNLANRVKDQLRAAWKFCLSVRKADWEFGDYPVVIREQKTDPSYVGTRLKQHRYVASIVNWPGLVGNGESPQESLQNLQSNFASINTERAKKRTPPPRPGTSVPLGFASQERVNLYPELADDFIRRILEIDSAWISDESSLWDFHCDHTNDVLVAKIKKVYGADVSDIDSGNLSEIFERIASVKK